MFLGFLEARLVGPFQANEPEERRSAAGFQGQSGVCRRVPALFFGPVVIVAREVARAEDGLHGDRHAPFEVQARGRLILSIDPVGRLLQEALEEFAGGLEEGHAQKFFQFLQAQPVRRAGGKSVYDPLDFLALGEDKLRCVLFFFERPEIDSRVRWITCWAYSPVKDW